MDPISIGLGIVGLGMSLFGSSEQSNISAQQAQVSGDIAKQEQGINEQKQQQMQLEARRSTLQNFRNAQMMQSQAQAAAVNQNAQFGSGLQGGIAGISGQATENALGINQGVEISKNIFGYNQAISADKMQLASLGSDMASAQGLSSLGSGIMKAGPIIGSFGKDISGFKIPGLGFGGPYI